MFIEEIINLADLVPPQEQKPTFPAIPLEKTLQKCYNY